MNLPSPNKLLLCVLPFCAGLTELSASECVDDYIGLDSPILKHRHILRDFEAPLTNEDEQKCLSFLKHRFSEATIASDRVRQNDLADWMLQRPEHVNSTTKVLLELIYDESADLLWREFCIQKLALAASQPGLSKPLKSKCCETLTDMAGDVRISFSGTSLLGLYRLHISNPEQVPANQIISPAENVLMHPGFPDANKVTALQIAGLLGSPYALEYARESVRAGKNIQLCISSIALLAQRGDAGDLSLLKALNDHKDLRLRKSSRAAVKRLENPTSTH